MLQEGREEVSRRFKQMDATGVPGLRERLLSGCLRRKRCTAGGLLPLWGRLLPPLPGKTGALGQVRTKPLFPSPAEAQAELEVCAQPSPPSGSGL